MNDLMHGPNFRIIPPEYKKSRRTAASFDVFLDVGI
jgi:hypothetical protein